MCASTRAVANGREDGAELRGVDVQIGEKIVLKVLRLGHDGRVMPREAIRHVKRKTKEEGGER